MEEILEMMAMGPLLALAYHAACAEMLTWYADFLLGEERLQA